MKKLLLVVLLFVFTLINSAAVCFSQAATKTTDPEKKLKDLGIQLATPSAPTANFLKAVRVGNLVYLSGHGPDKPEGGQVTGKLGSELNIDQGKQAARLVG